MDLWLFLQFAVQLQGTEKNATYPTFLKKTPCSLLRNVEFHSDIFCLFFLVICCLEFVDASFHHILTDDRIECVKF